MGPGGKNFRRLHCDSHLLTGGAQTQGIRHAKGKGGPLPHLPGPLACWPPALPLLFLPSGDGEPVSKKATGSAPLSRAARLLSWTVQLVSEEAIPPLTGKGLGGGGRGRTHLSVLHQEAPTVKPAAHNSLGPGPLWTMGPGTLYRLLPRLDGLVKACMWKLVFWWMGIRDKAFSMTCGTTFLV